MIIQRVNEGEPYSYGLNWRSDERTLLLINIVLPIWLIAPSEYEDFASLSIMYGWRVKRVFLYFRIRRWKYFPKNVRKILYNANIYFTPLGKQLFICNAEERVTAEGKI